MIHSIEILQNAVGIFDGLSKSEKMIVEVLPFLGISVVIGGLSILALILTQFKHLGEGKGHGGGHGHTKQPEKKKVEEPKTEKPASISSEEADIEQYAAVIGLSLYLAESSDKIALTEIKQFYNQTPWTSTSMFRQSTRFKRWQSLKK
ncbi:MAG TPA: hypothetical protein P5044_04240 [bacterium]|nr:hypothetical protein [bacterium]